MIDLTSFLKSLLSLPGLSAYETPVHDVIAEAWRPLVDELSTSKLGSLHALKRGRGAEPRRQIMIATHMDAIGLMVTGITQGLLRFTEIGGVDPRILPGQAVTVHGRRDLPGLVVAPPDRLLPHGHGDKPVEMQYLFVDTGLLPEEVKELVRVGDPISFAQPPLEMAGEAIAGHSLDNRASVAALTVCLDELQHMLHDWDIWAVATVQEEETIGGAITSPFEIRPDVVVAVDVTFAKGPGVSDYRGYPLGKGVTLGYGPNIHPALYKSFKELAEKLEIPHSLEVMPRHSGTDAYGAQVVAEGFPCMVLGIPLRYMHTPVEEVSLKDIQRTGRLMAEYIARLSPDYPEKINWES
jgi:endoglucanase